MRDAINRTMTATEATLAEMWRDTLKQSEVLATDDFFKLGGTSLAAISLVHRVETVFGPRTLSFDTLNSNPGLTSMARAIDEAQPAAARPVPIDIHAPFDLTPTQQAYWVGRADDQPLGGVGSHVYFEFDANDIEPDRLQAAVHALLRRHGMLRARFLPDGRQQIMPESPWSELVVHDLRGKPAAETEQALARIRDALSHRRLDVERGEVFDIQLTLAHDGFARIHCEFDLLVADGRSVQVILDDLSRHYSDPAKPLPPVGYEFPQYLADRRGQMADVRQADKDYWRDLLPSLPGAPASPLAVAPEHIRRPRFRRHSHAMPKTDWQRFVGHAQSHGVTPAMALATAYAEVLGRWSTEPRFLLNMPHFGRRSTHPAVPDMVGDFSNVVLFPVDLSAELPFAQRVLGVQRTHRANAAHGEYYGVEMLRDLAQRDSVYGNPAPIVFSYNVFDAFGGDMVTPLFRKCFGDLGYMITQTPQVWLDHQVFYHEDRVDLVWDAVDGLFEPGVVEDAFAAYTRLVSDLATDETVWSRPVEIALPAHQRAAREAVHSTTAPRPALLHDRFFLRAKEHPDQPALYRDGRTVSYGQLADSALRIAASLRELGVSPSEVVAVVMPKGDGEIAAVLGILAAGAAYVAVGPDTPPDRQRQILESAGVRLALTADDGPEVPVRVLTATEAASAEPLPHPAGRTPDSLAYLIFTSGSTGNPKGVEVSHRAAVNTIDWVNERYGVGEGDRALALTALDFDLSVYDNFGPLSTGGALVLVTEQQRRDPGAWWELIERHQVTIWNSVPLSMGALLSLSRPLPASLRLALLSGDWIPRDLPGRLEASSEGRCKLVALGGPTETAIWSNAFDVDRVEENWTSIPYGFPLSNQRHRVVDARGRDCPDWLAGELWVGGVCVAEGYRGDPRQTAERFVWHGGERWYKTGDLVRYRPGGVLEILGRTDFQVKINGFRVELGEIDATLHHHPAIDRSTTVAAGPRLVSFLVATNGVVDLDNLRSCLTARLPIYEVPAQFFVIDELPLTANGKVDRKTLTAWASQSVETAPVSAEPPRAGLEQTIAHQWELVLGRPVSRRSDNFVALGGNSLLAAKLAKSLRDNLHWQVSLRELYSAPTVAALATLLLDERKAPR
ncbi:amino acid adenylation domain-containing protein [Kibdelosporangium banguiense]|uniref:Phenyloxazoline synthase MbtB n=1 Tax=Kibdelosporangium banguiense TaxID=1365924 RepID=A0ABS4TSF4_9PSEU|nr:non-ribosomal peptide synthetase [Kibdelosporangium banguiense]MBP2326816.1 amino acid adenylation domain-containing protein [Kibdelosporangium banguiense]